MILEGWPAWTVFHAAWLALFAFARVAMHRARWDPRAAVAPALTRALPWMLVALYALLGFMYMTMLVAVRGNVAPAAVLALLAPQCAGNFAAAWLAAGGRRRAAGDPEPAHLVHERLRSMGGASASLLALWPALPVRSLGFGGMLSAIMITNAVQWLTRRAAGPAFLAECTPLEAEIMAITGGRRVLFVAGMKAGRLPRESPFEMPLTVPAGKPSGRAGGVGHAGAATPALCLTALDTDATTAALALSTCRVYRPESLFGRLARRGNGWLAGLASIAIVLGSLAVAAVAGVVVVRMIVPAPWPFVMAGLAVPVLAGAGLIRLLGLIPSAAGVHRAAFRLWRSAYPAAARTAPMYAEALARRWAWARCIHRGDVLALHLIHEPGLRALMAACLGGHSQADAFFREAGPRAVEAVWGVTSQASASQL